MMFCDFLFLYIQRDPFETVSTLKEFVPGASKLFPFRIDHFQKGDRKNFYRVVSSESVSISLIQHSSR